MIEEAVLGAIQKLKQERARLDAAIGQLEGLAGRGRVGRPRGRRRGRPPGRPPGRKRGRRRGRPPATAARGRGAGGRKNAPRGLLRAKIREVLKAAKGPLAPVVLRDRVIGAGYPAKNPKTLYTAIFAAAKKDPAIKKTKDGFSMK